MATMQMADSPVVSWRESKGLSPYPTYPFRSQVDDFAKIEHASDPADKADKLLRDLYYGVDTTREWYRVLMRYPALALGVPPRCAWNTFQHYAAEELTLATVVKNCDFCCYRTRVTTNGCESGHRDTKLGLRGCTLSGSTAVVHDVVSWIIAADNRRWWRASSNNPNLPRSRAIGKGKQAAAERKRGHGGADVNPNPTKKVRASVKSSVKAAKKVASLLGDAADHWPLISAALIVVGMRMSTVKLFFKAAAAAMRREMLALLEDGCRETYATRRRENTQRSAVTVPELVHALSTGRAGIAALIECTAMDRDDALFSGSFTLVRELLDSSVDLTRDLGDETGAAIRALFTCANIGCIVADAVTCDDLGVLNDMITCSVDAAVAAQVARQTSARTVRQTAARSVMRTAAQTAAQAQATISERPAYVIVSISSPLPKPKKFWSLPKLLNVSTISTSVADTAHGVGKSIEYDLVCIVSKSGDISVIGSHASSVHASSVHKVQVPNDRLLYKVNGDFKIGRISLMMRNSNDANAPRVLVYERRFSAATDSRDPDDTDESGLVLNVHGTSTHAADAVSASYLAPFCAWGDLTECSADSIESRALSLLSLPKVARDPVVLSRTHRGSHCGAVSTPKFIESCRLWIAAVSSTIDWLPPHTITALQEYRDTIDTECSAPSLEPPLILTNLPASLDQVGSAGFLAAGALRVEAARWLWKGPGSGSPPPPPSSVQTNASSITCAADYWETDTPWNSVRAPEALVDRQGRRGVFRGVGSLLARLSAVLDFYRGTCVAPHLCVEDVFPPEGGFARSDDSQMRLDLVDACTWDNGQVLRVESSMARAPSDVRGPDKGPPLAILRKNALPFVLQSIICGSGDEILTIVIRSGRNAFVGPDHPLDNKVFIYSGNRVARELPGAFNVFEREFIHARAGRRPYSGVLTLLRTITATHSISLVPQLYIYRPCSALVVSMKR
jgi:hypothetical protein